MNISKEAPSIKHNIYLDNMIISYSKSSYSGVIQYDIDKINKNISI